MSENDHNFIYLFKEFVTIYIYMVLEGPEPPQKETKSI